MSQRKWEKRLTGYWDGKRDMKFVSSPLCKEIKIALFYLRKKKTEIYNIKVRITIKEV